MRFTDFIKINFDVTYDTHYKPSKCSQKVFLANFDDLHMWHQNWYQYLWTSLCQFISFVNLLHSPEVWLFDIWHLFDNLHLLTIWHLFDILTQTYNHLSPSQGRAIFLSNSLSSVNVVISRPPHSQRFYFKGTDGSHYSTRYDVINRLAYWRQTCSLENLWEKDGPLLQDSWHP